MGAPQGLTLITLRVICTSSSPSGTVKKHCNSLGFLFLFLFFLAEIGEEEAELKRFILLNKAG